MPTTEPTYGWPLPEDIDPVADGAAAIRNLAGGVAGTLEAAVPPGQSLFVAFRQSGNVFDSFPTGVWTEVCRLTLPSEAPAGEYLITANIVVGSADGTPTIMYWRVKHEGLGIVTGDNRIDVSMAAHAGAGGRLVHPGGTAVIVTECNSQPKQGAVLTTGTQLLAQLVRGV